MKCFLLFSLALGTALASFKNDGAAGTVKARAHNDIDLVRPDLSDPNEAAGRLVWDQENKRLSKVDGEGRVMAHAELNRRGAAEMNSLFEPSSALAGRGTTPSARRNNPLLLEARGDTKCRTQETKDFNCMNHDDCEKKTKSLHIPSACTYCILRNDDALKMICWDSMPAKAEVVKVIDDWEMV